MEEPGAERRLTTCRASLAILELAVKARHWDCEAIRAGRNADLKTNGAILDAIVAVEKRNGCFSRLKRGCRDDGAFEMKKCDWREYFT